MDIRHQSLVIFRVLISGALLCLLASMALPHAQADELPDGYEIVEQFVKAIGGVEAFAKLENTTMKGEIRIPSAGITGPIEVIVQAGAARTTMTMGPLGVFDQGVVDGVAWSRNPLQGAQILAGDEKTNALVQTRFPPWPDWRDHYISVECVEVRELTTRTLAKIVLTPHEGRPETRYYDMESHLLVRTETTMIMPSGETTVVSLVDDWRMVGNILEAHRMEQQISGQTIVTTFETIAFNVELSPDAFTMPDEVAALLAATDQSDVESPEPR